MHARFPNLFRCGLLLCFVGPAIVSGQIESAGSFVTAGSDRVAGPYRMTGATESQPGVGTTVAAGPYAERSGGVAIVNNPPHFAIHELAARGNPDVIIHLLGSDLLSVTGAHDVDGDPLLFRVISDVGTLRQGGVVKSSANLTINDTNTFWTPPNPVLGVNLLFRSAVDDGVASGAHEVRFIAQYSPMIRFHPQTNITASAAGALGITMVTDGTGPLNHQWFKDGQPLAGQSQSDLYLSPVNRDASGVYSLSVTGPFGAVVSSNVLVRIVVPQIMSVPEAVAGGGLRIRFNDFNDQLLDAGNLAEFRVEASTDFLTWHPLTNAALTLVDGRVEFIDAETAAEGRRFYRIVSQ